VRIRKKETRKYRIQITRSKNKKAERKESLEKARAWHSDHLREKQRRGKTK